MAEIQANTQPSTPYRAYFEQGLVQINVSGSPFEVGEMQVGGKTRLAYVNAPQTVAELIAPGRSGGDAEFLIYQDERWSFSEFFNRVDKLTLALNRELQLNAGDHIAIAMRNYPEWLVAYAAIACLGGVAVPLNSWSSGSELQVMVEDSQAKLVICDIERFQGMRSAGGQVAALVVRAGDIELNNQDLHWHTLLDRVSDSDLADSAPNPAVNAEDPAMIMYTSGTSGAPKGALFCQAAVCQSIVNFEAGGAIAFMGSMEAFSEFMARGLPPKSLLCVPLFHVSGLYAQFLLNLRGSRALVMMHKWQPEVACELIHRERISSVAAAPSMILDLLTCDAFEQIDASSVINMSGGGAATPDRVAQLIREKIPKTLPGAGWGMTETGASGSFFTGYFAREKPRASGFINPVVKLRFHDEDGNELEANQTGEIWVNSPASASGYWNRPEANRTEFIDGWFRTGDIGYLDEDGCLVICDRIKDMVIRGGENIYPVEVENCIQSLAGVIRAAALGLPDERMGERLVAVVNVSSNTEIDEARIRQHCADNLAAYKVPEQVLITTDELPINATNKVLKRQVKEQYFANGEEMPDSWRNPVRQ